MLHHLISALSWITHAILIPPEDTVVQYKDITKVARININDVKLPGKFNEDNMMFSVDLDGSEIIRMSGTHMIELLVNRNNVSLEWIPFSNFTSGNPPEGTVVGGLKPDGKPLYIAQKNGNCGYFDPDDGCASVQLYGAQCYDTFDVLVIKTGEYFLVYCYRSIG